MSIVYLRFSKKLPNLQVFNNLICIKTILGNCSDFFDAATFAIAAEYVAGAFAPTAKYVFFRTTNTPRFIYTTRKHKQN